MPFQKMERDCKRKKQQTSEKKKRESDEKRSPLQNLNRIPIHKPKAKKSSNLSSSSSAPAVSGENPKCCLRFLLSSNSCSSSSSSSSASPSRSLLDKKLKTFSEIAINQHNKSTADTSKLLIRSKENEVRRKPFLQKSEKNQPQCITQSKYGKSNEKPVNKSGQRSKLSSVEGNPQNKLKRGSLEFQAKMKNPRENNSGKRAFELLGASNSSNLNSAENCTPVSRVASGHALDSMNSVYERDNGNNATSVKTPPIEASLSPEIQRQSHSKTLISKSGATPVCYGAGHLLSGVTDKRKCRRRGSLRGGPEKTVLFDDEKSDENLSNDLMESSIPLLAEASVRWHLSPCNEANEDHGNQCKLDLLSSQSMLCGNEHEFLCADSSYSGGDDVGNVTSKRRNRNVILSPRKATEMQGLLETSDCNMVESLFVTSPKTANGCIGIGLKEGKHFSGHLIGDNSELSIGSLSSGNIIQTPDSDSTSDMCFGMSRLEVDHSNVVWPELDSITETLEGVNLSPRMEMSTWNQPRLGFRVADMASPPISANASQIEKNVDSVSSWVSDTTSDNVSLSQMRISWRDVLGSRIVETDEFDCCRFLSDEEIKADGFASEQLMLHPLTEAVEDKETFLGSGSGENKENDMRIGDDLSPMHLDYEPCISTRGKEKSSHKSRTDACAESICTERGVLVASDDSDSTYFHENRLFQIK